MAPHVDDELIGAESFVALDQTLGDLSLQQALEHVECSFPGFPVEYRRCSRVVPSSREKRRAESRRPGAG